jgi:hypothetical protein
MIFLHIYIYLSWCRIYLFLICLYVYVLYFLILWCPKKIGSLQNCQLLFVFSFFIISISEHIYNDIRFTACPWIQDLCFMYLYIESTPHWGYMGVLCLRTFPAWKSCVFWHHSLWDEPARKGCACARRCWLKLIVAAAVCFPRGADVCTRHSALTVFLVNHMAPTPRGLWYSYQTRDLTPKIFLLHYGKYKCLVHYIKKII